VPQRTSGSPPKPAAAEAGELTSPVRRLTRRGNQRLPKVEKQIAEAGELDATGPLARAEQSDEAEPGYLAAESLVHFIRLANRDGNQKLRDDLFRGKRPVCLSITHKFSSDEKPELDVSETG